MSNSLYSPSWYRMAELKPRLRAHAQVHRQRFRGEIWYVLQDHQSGRFHRLSPAAHHVICLMDGRRTVQRIWEMASERLGEDQPTQEEIVRLLAQLHAADLLVGEVPPLMQEMSERSDRQARREVMLKIRNPLALRFPLFDPDRFLERTVPLVRPLFTVWGFAAWVALVAFGAALIAMHWTPLTTNVGDQALTAQNLALMACVYPLIKALHELGHAYATKVWGGEVHELGVMVLVLVPVPYVDASSSSAFREKWRRAVVGGAGIMVEAALAAFAMMVWISAEPGLVRAIAFNTVLIAGVSTLLFNGNPLLRFDGYYVFCDLIEVPNLGTRANKYVFYLLHRYGFGLTDVTSPVTGPREAPWFLFYACASFVYRMVIMLTIALLIATKLFFVGIALALFSLANGLLWPLAKGLNFLLASPRLGRKRAHAVAVSAAVLAAPLAAAFAIPLPYATLAEGIVWTGESSAVRVLSDGAVVDITTGNGVTAAPGARLVAMEDPILAAGNAVLARQRDELQLRLEAVRLTNLVQANMLREQIGHLDGQIEAGQRRLDDLTITATKAGLFLLSEETDLPGRYLRRGDVVGYLVAPGDEIVRVVVPQAEVDLVRRKTRRVDIRLVDRPERTYPAEIAREMPAASAEVPHLALTTVGGGPIAIDPSRSDKPRPLETIFYFDLAVPPDAVSGRLGGRVHVRFEHDPEPLAFRLIRSVRQVFLRRLGV